MSLYFAPPPTLLVHGGGDGFGLPEPVQISYPVWGSFPARGFLNKQGTPWGGGGSQPEPVSNSPGFGHLNNGGIRMTGFWPHQSWAEKFSPPRGPRTMANPWSRRPPGGWGGWTRSSPCRTQSPSHPAVCRRFMAGARRAVHDSGTNNTGVVPRPTDAPPSKKSSKAEYFP